MRAFGIAARFQRKAIRWAVVGLFCTIAFVMNLMIDNSIRPASTDTGAPVLPTPAVSVSPPDWPDWTVAPHPPRSSTSKIVVSATSKGPIVSIENEITLHADDSLIGEIDSGAVSSRSLANYVLGDLDDSNWRTDYPAAVYDSPPLLEYSAGEPLARIRFHGRMIYATDYNLTLAFGRDANAPDAAALVSARNIVITLNGYRVLAITGKPFSRDAVSLVFDGNPQMATVKVQLNGDAPHSTANIDTVTPRDAWDKYLGPFSPLAYLVRTGWVAWGMVLIMPWIVMILGYPGCRTESALQARRIASWIAILTVLICIFQHYVGDQANYIFMADVVILIPLIVAAWARRLSQGRWWTRRSVTIQLLAAIALIAAGIAAAVATHLTIDYTRLIATVSVGVGALLGCVIAISGRRNVTAGMALSLTLVGAIIAGSELLDLFRSAYGTTALIALLTSTTFGLPSANATVTLVDLWRPARRAQWATLAVLVAGILYLPIIQLLHDSGQAISDMSRPLAPMIVTPMLLITLNVGLAIAAVGLLRRFGSNNSVIKDPVAWVLGIALTLCVIYSTKPFTWSDTFDSVIAWFALWWLLPPSRWSKAGQLASVETQTHSRLVRAETRRRLIQLSAHDLYRRARSDLGKGEMTLPKYDRSQRNLDDAASLTGPDIGGIPISDALGTGAGCTSWQNAVASMVFALPISAASIAFEAWTTVRHGATMTTFSETVQILDAARHLCRWIVYALIFGYFYPLLRGRTPLVKAFALATAIAVIELTPIVALSTSAETDSDLQQTMIAIGIRLGQVIVFSFTIGLLWERRLGWLAGITWDRLRNIRSIRALAAPATTVIIAAATTVATALAGAVVAGLLAGTSAKVPTQLLPSNSVSSSPVESGGRSPDLPGPSVGPSVQPSADPTKTR